MATAAILVSLVASVGWLFLNYRALQAFELSFEKKAGMAVGWILIIAVLAFVLTRMGF